MKPIIYHPVSTGKINPGDINMSFPHSEIHDRLDAIGYHDPATSDKALADMSTIVVNLRLGKLMISRKVIDAHGNEGIFTAFKKMKSSYVTYNIRVRWNKKDPWQSYNRNFTLSDARKVVKAWTKILPKFEWAIVKFTTTTVSKVIASKK